MAVAAGAILHPAPLTMPADAWILPGLAFVSAVAWVYLVLAHGGFWRADRHLEGPAPDEGIWPEVCAVVPARNEAAHVEDCLAGLLGQRYPGRFRIVLVDDDSHDDTASRARRAAEMNPSGPRITVLSAPPLKPGWSGKLAALDAGIRGSLVGGEPDYFLLVDADVVADPDLLRGLAGKAEDEGLDLVSLMVRLDPGRGLAALLVPAFVYFFMLLYPFARVNDPRSRVAAAAGGCILLRRRALEAIGGLAAIRGAVIDDCALARAVKPGGRIRLGLTTGTVSTRPYRRVRDVWEMVARTAFDQLRYSPILLLATLAGMGLLFAVPVVGTAAAIAPDGPADRLAALLGAGAWSLLAASFYPTVCLYRHHPAERLLIAAALPVAGLLYCAMTVDSALRHWAGRGTRWRGRTIRPGADHR